jgi:hypothetical protein
MMTLELQVGRQERHLMSAGVAEKSVRGYFLMMAFHFVILNV